MSEPMQEAIPAFVVGSDLAHWSCGTTLPMTSAALKDAFLSFSGAPLFVLISIVHLLFPPVMRVREALWHSRRETRHSPGDRSAPGALRMDWCRPDARSPHKHAEALAGLPADS
jgi:hypothetical protein